VQNQKESLLQKQNEENLSQKEARERESMKNFTKREYTNAELEDLEAKTESEKNDSKILTKGIDSLGFNTRETKMIGKGIDIFNDEKKLNKASGMWEKAEKNKKLLKWIIRDETDNDVLENVGNLVERVASKYVKEEVNEKTGETELQIKSFEEVLGEEESSGFFEKLKLITTNPIEFAKYMVVKFKLKDALFQAKDIAELTEKCEAIKKEAELRIDQAHNIVDDSKGTIKRFQKTHAERKIANKLSQKKLAKLHQIKGNFEKESRELANNMGKLGAEKFAQKQNKLFLKYGAEFANQGGPVTERFLRNNKQLGFGVKGGMVYVGFQMGKEFFHSLVKGDWKGFQETMKDPTWYSEVAEALPIWGSIKSFERLDDYSSDLPTWTRWAEFGINAGLDAVAIVPFILGTVFGGIGGVGVLGARAAIGRSASMGIKGIAKWFGKKGGKELLEQSVQGLVEKGTKEMLEEGVQTMTKLGTKKTLTKISTQSVGKKILAKMTPQNWEDGWKSLLYLVKKQGQWALLNEMALFSWEKFGPDKEDVVEFAMDQSLSDTQKKFVQKTGVRNAML
jgi:hypothetical protein